MSLPYWNCYGFPGPFVAAELIDQVVGFSLAGAAMVPLVKPRLSSV